MLLPPIAALVPLVIAPGFLFFYDVTPKIALLSIGVAAALPWFAPSVLWTRREGRWLCIVCTAQACSLAISTALSSRPGLSVFGTNWRRFGLITQLALLLFTVLAAADMTGGQRRLQAYLRAAAAAAIPISLYGIAQYFGWDPWIPKRGYHIGEGIWTIVRPPGTLGYVSYFAGYLVFAIFLAVALYSLEERGWWKRASAVAVILAAFAIVLSGTRAAILAVLVGAAYLWFRSGWRIELRRVWIGAGALAAIALFYFSPGGQLLRSRTRWYAEDAWGGARLLLWRDSLALASRHWLAGSGPETFSSEFPQVQSAALSRAYPDFYHESAHNILLDALTAQGVAGLATLLAAIALGIYQAQKNEGPVAGALGACFVSGLAANQFVVFTAPTALCFCLTLAMLVALGKKSVSSPRLPLAIAAPVSAALALFAIRLLFADHQLLRVQADLEAGKAPAVAERYRRVRDWGLTADIWYSRQLAAAAARSALDPVTALRAWQQALEAGYRAARTAEDPHNAWYSLATLHARQNDYRKTEQCLRAAIGSSPNWFKPHWMLAQVLSSGGRREEALTEARLAAGLNGGKNPEVAAVLEKLQ